MKFRRTPIEGLVVIEFEPHIDERGYFMRTFCESELERNGVDFKIAQVNRSLTTMKGAIRGMHFQKSPNEEKKIVQCIHGSIYDVAVDLRPGSSTYLTHYGIELTATDNLAFYIPGGFAHGFQTLERKSEVEYFMSTPYVGESARGVRWNDPALTLTWPLEITGISNKDKNWPYIAK